MKVRGLSGRGRLLPDGAVGPPRRGGHLRVQAVCCERRRRSPTGVPCPSLFSKHAGISTTLRKVAGIFLLLVSAVPLIKASDLFGEGVAGKNREGNQLYLQGKFADAERAYLEAQGIAPGRPELLYNHGNALIKQKKVEPGLQQLRQAAAKGTQGLQASAWYNSGNALFEAGNFQEAVQAYIQALRSNPSDRDAKHNLELALKRLQQQQQKQDDQKEQSGKKDGEQQKQDQGGKPQEQKGTSQSAASGQQAPREQAGQRPQQQDGSLSRDQALQILDALQSQELAEQKKRLLRLEQRRAPGRDW